MHVASLHIYPVKGCRAVDLTEAAVERRGLAHDRRWMIVDEAGKFVTQREQPKLAAVAAAIRGNALVLSRDGGEITVATPAPDAPRLPVQLWKQQIEGHSASEEANAWLSDYLGIRCRLVYQGELPRGVSPQYAPEGTMASYADGFPLLITVTASLDDLNKRMRASLPMNRFRPNIVVEGAPAWSEDGWKKLRIGALDIDISKPCTRCVVTTTDQQTGAKGSNEPLATLKTFRLLRTPALTGVVFGQNAVPLAEGGIKTGDTVHILESRTPPAFAAVG
jgi:uncharacterized protein YcbX